MAIKKHLKSLSFFAPLDSPAIIIAMLGRKLESVTSRYNLIAKSKFDKYQTELVSVKKMGTNNLISFISKYSGNRINFSIRRCTTDIMIFDEILYRGAYWPILHICDTIRLKPKFIIDCGANIGSSVIFFKDIFPESNIICVEPEEDNITMLKNNILINNYKNIEVIQAGVWDRNEPLNINENFRGGRERELSFSLESTNDYNGSIQGVTVQSLLKNFGINQVDILKIDIEGAETKLFKDFESSIAIFNLAKIIAIELHDEVIDRFQFTKFVDQAGLNHISFGEVTYIYSDK